MPEVNLTEWEAYLACHPDAHLLQTAAWGELKAGFGWQPLRWIYTGGDGVRLGAQVLVRSLPMGFSLAYLPKGPVSDLPDNADPAHWQPLWAELDAYLRSRRAVFLKVEPDLWEPPAADPVGRDARSAGSHPTDATDPTSHSGRVSNPTYAADPTSDVSRDARSAGSHPTDPIEPASPVGRVANPTYAAYAARPPAGFSASPQDIQPPRTLLVDLRGSEDDVLARMKQKTRYNIRLALRKGVVVYPSADIDAFHKLMNVTGTRDRFGVHSLDYYRQAYELFYPKGECELLLAAYESEPLAALMVFSRGSRAWYFYGASSDAHRDRMPAYLLQWEAMRWARARGCTQYDLWGVPDVDEDVLEAGFTERTGDLWGVYRFKRGFGGSLHRAFGPWDRVYNPLLYWLYSRWAAGRIAG